MFVQFRTVFRQEGIAVLGGGDGDQQVCCLGQRVRQIPFGEEQWANAKGLYRGEFLGRAGCPEELPAVGGKVASEGVGRVALAYGEECFCHGVAAVLTASLRAARMLRKMAME